MVNVERPKPRLPSFETEQTGDGLYLFSAVQEGCERQVWPQSAHPAYARILSVTVCANCTGARTQARAGLSRSIKASRSARTLF